METFNNYLLELFDQRDFNFTESNGSFVLKQVINGTKVLAQLDNLGNRYDYKFVVFDENDVPTTKLGAARGNTKIWNLAFSALFDLLERVEPNLVSFEAVWEDEQKRKKLYDSVLKRYLPKNYSFVARHQKPEYMKDIDETLEGRTLYTLKRNGNKRN